MSVIMRERRTANLALVEPYQRANNPSQQQPEPNKVELGDVLSESEAVFRGVEVESEE